MTDELKPCPFCGCENVTLVFWDDDEMNDCTVKCHGINCCDGFDYWGSQDDVIAKWNTRPIEDAQAAEIAKAHARITEFSPADPGETLMDAVNRMGAELERLNETIDWAARIMLFVLDAVTYEDEEAAKVGLYGLPSPILQNIDSFLAAHPDIARAARERGEG